MRSVLGPGLLAAHGPWVHVYIIPFDQWAMDGRIPDWEGFRAHLNASTPEKADEVLAIAYGSGRHAGRLYGMRSAENRKRLLAESGQCSGQERAA